MARRYYLLTLVPFVLLLVFATRVHAVCLQPRLTMAGTASEFERIVTESGGLASVQHGFYLDLVFIAVFLVIVPAVLHRGHGRWQVPVAAATLDLAEDALSLVLLRISAADFWFASLWAVAAVKLAAYLWSLAEVLLRAIRQPLPG
ncbi:MAG: hypothetical protein ABI047_04280 [Jatrophihabitantaceae bacterium]